MERETKIKKIIESKLKEYLSDSDEFLIQSMSDLLNSEIRSVITDSLDRYEFFFQIETTIRCEYSSFESDSLALPDDITFVQLVDKIEEQLKAMS